MSSPEENESFGSGLCRKNIETLLAAVAQTQGFDDDEAVTSATERTEGNDNGGTSISAENGDVDDPQTVIGAPLEIDGDSIDEQSYTVVLCLPAPPAEQQTSGSGGKRKRGRKEKGQVEEAVKPPPKRQTRARKGEDVLAAPRVEQHLMATAQKRKAGRQPKGAVAEPPPPPNPQPPAPAPAPVQPAPRVEQQMVATAERRKSGRLQKGAISAAAVVPPPNSLPPAPPPPPASGPPSGTSSCFPSRTNFGAPLQLRQSLE